MVMAKVKVQVMEVIQHEHLIVQKPTNMINYSTLIQPGGVCGIYDIEGRK